MSDAHDQPDIRNVEPASIQRGPLRRESLTKEQEQRVAAIYRYIAPYFTTTLEQFEITFLRDADPDSELNVWSAIVQAHSDFLKQRSERATGIGRDVFACILSTSVGAGKPSDVPQSLWDDVVGHCKDR